jgi:hypothetical protein
MSKNSARGLEPRITGGKNAGFGFDDTASGSDVVLTEAPSRSSVDVFDQFRLKAAMRPGSWHSLNNQAVHELAIRMVVLCDRPVQAVLVIG